MKQYILAALTLFAASQLSYAQNGFKPLFDGKTTTGWHTYGKNQCG